MNDRRNVLQGLGALAAAAALPIGKASAQPAKRKPPRLRRGDTVGLVEPAGFTNDGFDLELIKEAIAAMGLVPKPAPHLLARYGYLAGKDRERAADLNAMYADRNVRAVFAVRGGWGSARILPYLNFDVIRANPKLLIGFSDITALHMAFAARAGFTTIHGPMRRARGASSHGIRCASSSSTAQRPFTATRSGPKTGWCSGAGARTRSGRARPAARCSAAI